MIKSQSHKSLDFQQLSHVQHFGHRVKIYQIVIKTSMVISTDISAVLLRYFQISSSNLIISRNFGCNL